MKEKEMISGKISCIVPTYKRSDTLLRAIDSIINQTYTNIEILVVDDNHPNDEFSLEVQRKLEEIQDERVIYLQQEKHINGAAARNYGIKHACGEYISFLDDDDEWVPEKLEKQVKLLETLNSEYGGVSCLATIYKDNEIVRQSPPYSEEGLHKKVLEHSVSIFTGTVLFRKASLDKVGYFNESLQRHQDLQLFTDFLAHYKIKPLNESMMIIHTDDASNRPNTQKFIMVKESFFEAMEDNLNMYSDREQENIKASHYFEIVFTALKEKKFNYVIRYLLKIGLNFTAYKNVFNRFRQRLN